MIDVTREEAAAVVVALADVASAGGTAPLSAADRSGIAGAWTTVLGQAGDPPVAADHSAAADLAAVVAALPAGDGAGDGDEAGGDPGAGGLRLLCVRLAAVMAFVDGRVDDAKMTRVLVLARALGVHADFVTAVHELLVGEVAWVAADQIRHNIATIPGVPYDQAHPYAAFLPYTDGREDPALAARYDALADLPDGSLGKAFYEHYTRNGFAFPGRPEAVVEAWATFHDTLHVLSGYSTSAQGEILVAAFTVGQLRHNSDPMESHILPTILIYHLGIDINKGLNAGDRERMAADPDWAMTYAGTIHLGLDPRKLFVAWERGAAMAVDVYDPAWDFWEHVPRPLDELRAEYAIAPLDPADAALDDDEVRADPFRRPGEPDPPVPGSSS